MMHVDMDDPSPYHAQESIKIDIVFHKGNMTHLECPINWPVDVVKITALGQLRCDQLDCFNEGGAYKLLSINKVGSAYKLVSIDKKRALTGKKTLREEEISNGDILLMLEVTQNDATILSENSNDKKITESMIEEATRKVKPKNMDRKVTEPSNPFEFQGELRKILISLVDYGEKLLRNHKSLSPILKDTKAVNIDKINEKEHNEIDQDALKQLTDMGFAVERSRRALKLNNMSPLEAMDWLLAYESSSSSSSNQPCSFTNQVNHENTDMYPKVPAIVDSYRKFKRKHFKPNPEHFKNLKQLGFEDNEILDALWIHCNNEVLAVDWLLKERRPKSEDLIRGLKKDSPIYKALLENPIVQLGLFKPKVFFAFLQLIEEPNSTTKWLSDVETAPVITQIFRIYHSEKQVSEKDSL
ncbi:kip1 ubiquitination-promoting complex subunit 2 isoform X2 [Brevipalpus obovatus]|uniref:kip1 ubiquitination-promoting complex subunit 2 isoform X2 n=1 Tax=Brevipalpus obovatus TaxID=246614 RepID=UPI003D9DCE81